jgi:RNA polymerase sigma factor (sigma-70 family)
MPAATPQSLSVERLYTAHNGWLQQWLRRRLGCPALAADLAQDTFVRLLAKPRKLHDLSGSRSYLRTVADRLCIDLWRRQSIEQAWLEVLAARAEPVAISAQDHAIIIEAFCELDEMLRRLPKQVAQAFMLSQLEGLSYREIATRLQVSERTVKSYMAKAMLECLLIESRFQDAMQP